MGHSLMPSKGTKIRLGNPHDYPSVKEVFRACIDQGPEEFYSEEQRSAWKESIENKERWHRKMRDDYFLIAENESGSAIGFASLSWDGYLDTLYVHPDFQRQKVAQALYDSIEKEARNKNYDRIYSDASHWAKPFFEANGFLEIAENEVERKGIKLTNFRMERHI